MSRRLDVLYPHQYQDREGKEQTSWYRIGSAFEADSGQITVSIAVLPAAPQVNGEYKFILREPRASGQQGGNGGSFI